MTSLCLSNQKEKGVPGLELLIFMELTSLLYYGGPSKIMGIPDIWVKNDWDKGHLEKRFRDIDSLINIENAKSEENTSKYNYSYFCLSNIDILMLETLFPRTFSISYDKIPLENVFYSTKYPNILRAITSSEVTGTVEIQTAGITGIRDI